MQISVIKFLPRLPELQAWIIEKEAELQNTFGMPLKLFVAESDFTFSIDAIVKLVSDSLGVPVVNIVSQSREEVGREARQIAMYLCKKYIPKVTPKDIGEYFGKERTTVIHSYEKVEDLLVSNDAKILAKLTLCEKNILTILND